jgi:hypothetical protein
VPPPAFVTSCVCVCVCLCAQAKGFYKGVGSPLVGVSAINSVLFWTWGRSQR